MNRVWTDGLPAGVIDRFESRGSTFAYDPGLDQEREVSLTVPFRTASWNSLIRLAPIFEMNLPEGVVRERLRLAFAKATGSFDDIDLLTVVGVHNWDGYATRAWSKIWMRTYRFSRWTRFLPSGEA
jgi:serine/threonine-protein kinase HipA